MLKDVGGVGQRGKVIEVSDGYALNYLIPHGMAEQATVQKEMEARKRMQTEDAQREKEAAATLDTIKQLSGAQIRISAKASEKGGLFKSISAMDIAKAIMAQKGILVRIAHIKIETPIKNTGEHPVVIHSAGAECTLTLVVGKA